MGKRKTTKPIPETVETPKNPYEQYTVEEMIEALKLKKGMITLAAKHVGCAYNTMRYYIDTYPHVKEALEMERSALDDAVEMKLYSRIEKDDTAAIIFYAKTRLRHRGYAERQEITGADGKDLTTTIIIQPMDISKLLAPLKPEGDDNA